MGLRWRWKSYPEFMGLSDQVTCLSSIIASTVLTVGTDRTTCMLDKDGDYKVYLLRKKIDDKTAPIVNTSPISWYKLIPLKVLTFVWRAALGRIPTKMALAGRGIQVQNSYCSACIGEEEYVGYFHNQNIKHGSINFGSLISNLIKRKLKHERMITYLVPLRFLDLQARKSFPVDLKSSL
uniref:Reverse transcriptase zinc-binding domain-containing protein n=1 Tax=Lactuca sativa TaxID=4236 RepID=A0A9R1VDS5_LACSA|nr:hypothetical protein LSAT_V11C500233050 [Lactuca sativa]